MTRLRALIGVIVGIAAIPAESYSTGAGQQDGQSAGKPSIANKAKKCKKGQVRKNGKCVKRRETSPTSATNTTTGAATTGTQGTTGATTTGTGTTGGTPTGTGTTGPGTTTGTTGMGTATGTGVTGAPPVIEAESVSDTTATDATLNATINPEGLLTDYEFQIDTESTYDFTQPNCPWQLPGFLECQSITVGKPLPPGLVEPRVQSIPAGGGPSSLSLDLATIRARLEPGTTYHFRVRAANTSNGETVTGSDRSFTTP